MKRWPNLLAIPFALLFAVPAIQGQGQAPASKAEQLYRQAAQFHAENKHDLAAAKMKMAEALDPTNLSFQAYRYELEALAKQDRFDSHALEAPANVEDTVEHLAAYLIKPAKNDTEKTRLIFRWITDRIAYDVEALTAINAGQRFDTSPEATLKNRKAVCQGYATLFDKLAKLAGLEVVRVSGEVKPFGNMGGPNARHEKHMWNAVKLDGQWRLIDPTWGAGNTRNKKFHKLLKAYYFLTPPENLILTHLPSDPKWQLLNPPIAREEYLAWPRIERYLFEKGVKPADALAKLKEGPLVRTADVSPGTPRMKITFHAIPLEGKLKAGMKYRFRVEAAGIQDMRVFTGGTNIPLTKKGTVFEGEAEAKGNQLMLGAQIPNGKGFQGMAIYTVE